MPQGMLSDRDEESLPLRLAGAFFISVLLHTTFFAVLHIGNQLHWWEAKPFAMFRKVRLTPEEIARIQEEQRQREAQLPTVFVQVTEPSEEAPPETPYYSSRSSRAANPEPAPGNQPRLDGTQRESVRLVDAPRVPTARATPPPPPEPKVSTESRPDPVRSAPPRPVSVVESQPPRVVEPPAEPVRPPGIGELALVQPQVRPPPEPEPAPRRQPPLVPPQTPPPLPSAPVGNPTPPPRARPRTVTEARLRQDLLAGQKMQQDGGVPQQGQASLDVQGTGFGAYDEALVMAVQNRWFALLDARRYAGRVTGRVVVNFRLYSDGSVRIVEPTESSVDALHETLCVRAIRDPAPYEKWPSDMLRMIGSNFRVVRFTFYYN